MLLKTSVAAVILAAGEGKRMKSRRPKMIHQICGKPMIYYAIRLAESAGAERQVVVLGHGAEDVTESVSSTSIDIVIQEKQLGTADALKTAMKALEGFEGDILVLCGDMPLLLDATITGMLESHSSNKPSVTILTAIIDDPYGYGRIVRDQSGSPVKIIEERDADESQKKITEINTGTYCFNASHLRQVLEEVTADNDQNEYYLTDVIGILKERSLGIGAVICENAQEALGINSRQQLAQAAKIMQTRINDAFMESGVTLVDPDSIYIDQGARIGRDTIILPHTFIGDDCVIGEQCLIGPSVSMQGSTLGDDVSVEFAVLRGVTAQAGVKIGPYSSLRPGTILQQNSKAGTFVEIKKTTVGEGSKVPHLSYIGDTTIGRDANIGAGSITCNYDGMKKHVTEIGDEAFIGSDTMLVAPVKIGKKAITGAGSVITKDVPDGALGIERSDQRILDGYAKKRSERDNTEDEEGDADAKFS